MFEKEGEGREILQALLLGLLVVNSIIKLKETERERERERYICFMM